jgi:hypothetical protein
MVKLNKSAKFASLYRKNYRKKCNESIFKLVADIIKVYGYLLDNNKRETFKYLSSNNTKMSHYYLPFDLLE